MSGKAENVAIQHPSTTRLFQNAARRFLKVRKRYEVAANTMWAGTLAANFTDDELVLLKDYLSYADRSLLKQIGRPIPDQHARKR
jgi:hypothetical protein